MDCSFPAPSIRPISVGSTDSAIQRKLVDLLRFETTRLILLESEATRSGNGCDMATLFAVARANIESGIHASSQRNPDDAFDKQKYMDMLMELPSAHIALDVNFRRWTEETVCPFRPDVEMIAAC